MATRKSTKKTAKRSAARRGAKPAMSHEAMMAAWQKAMTPGAAHRRLEPLVGSFRAKTTFVVAPGAPPEVSEGTSEHRWVLGGRFLAQVYRGTAMGMPFEGIGYTGYDNVQKKYIGFWMDSFGTGFMPSESVGAPRAGAIDFDASAVDPSGKTMRFLCKVRIQSGDRHTYEMWAPAPGGKRFLQMKVEYTRAV